MKMNTAFLKSHLGAEISAKGFAHLKYPLSQNHEDLIANLGKVIHQTEIRENSKSSRLLASNQPMHFHTDHNEARYIAWFCNSQSAKGGASLLIDTKDVLKYFSKQSLLLLQEVHVNSHKIFYKDRLSAPLLSINENKVQVYYSSWLLNVPACVKHQKAVALFEEKIRSVTPARILLSEGDLLIIDNHRMLHGREGFPSNSNRWLTRYWIN